MASIELSDTEFGQLMFVLAHAEGKGITWAMVNPLMMKIGEQLRLQSLQAKAQAPAPDIRVRTNSDGKEAAHEQAG